MSNRVYQGIRNPMGMPEVYVLENTTRRTLKDQLVLLYEPIEFDWGYKGKEPRNLAIALLADALEGGDDPNVDLLFQRLIDESVSTLPVSGWQITQADLLSWVYGRIERIPIHPLPLKAIGGGVPGSLN